MLKSLSKLLLKVWGFKVRGSLQHELKKKIYVVVPHTSNWDFVLAVSLKFAYSIEVNFIGKHTLFKWPYGFFFRALGGYPVDRSQKNNLVETITYYFQNNEKFTFALAPEGTRSKVDHIKEGFYHIARKANVPIILVSLDYGRKKVRFEKAYFLSDNKEEEMNKIRQHFADVEGKVPEKSYAYHS